MLESSRGAAPDLQAVGVVAIGRNEGERLTRCFDALPSDVRHVVYVDSASSDDSVEQARRRGIDVVELDMSLPFTAARARNAGVRRLNGQWPGLRFVQLVDGDCALAADWLEAALAEMESNPRLAIVCGRRREVHPEASIYNRLADMEWDTPIGDAESCGGDVLVRLAPLIEVGGFDDRLIAGEEPELCARLRAQGWGIRRIDREMTRHDAAMTRFRQWWRRAVRSGYGVAEVNAMHPTLWRRESRSILAWGLFLPAAALASALAAGALGLLLLLAYPALGLRMVVRLLMGDKPLGDAALYATFGVLGKFAEAMGAAKYWRDRVLRWKSGLIEYK